MIVLDTNVVSEPMRTRGNPAVQAWLDRQVAETMYLTATSLAELPAGIEILLESKRKEGLTAALAELIATLFGPRILSFDQHTAVAYASVISRARAHGKIISVADGQIAAIAVLRGFTVATRDTGPFLAAGVPVINPWELEPSDRGCKPKPPEFLSRSLWALHATER
jgi:toxin FitB